MSVLAAVRPDETSLALFVHVLGAMVLVGGAFTALVALLLSWRSGGRDVATLARLAFRALLFAALPGWIAMRAGAEWVYSKEGWSGVPDEPSWLGFGYVIADGGGVILLITLIVAGIGARRLARADGGRSTLMRVATVLSALLLVDYLVAVWAMSGKPDKARAERLQRRRDARRPPTRPPDARSARARAAPRPPR